MNGWIIYGKQVEEDTTSKNDIPPNETKPGRSEGSPPKKIKGNKMRNGKEYMEIEWPSEMFYGFCFLNSFNSHPNLTLYEIMAVLLVPANK